MSSELLCRLGVVLNHNIVNSGAEVGVLALAVYSVMPCVGYSKVGMAGNIPVKGVARMTYGNGNGVYLKTLGFKILLVFSISESSDSNLP